MAQKDNYPTRVFLSGRPFYITITDPHSRSENLAHGDTLNYMFLISAPFCFNIGKFIEYICKFYFKHLLHLYYT